LRSLQETILTVTGISSIVLRIDEGRGTTGRRVGLAGIVCTVRPLDRLVEWPQPK